MINDKSKCWNRIGKHKFTTIQNMIQSNGLEWSTGAGANTPRMLILVVIPHQNE